MQGACPSHWPHSRRGAAGRGGSPRAGRLPWVFGFGSGRAVSNRIARAAKAAGLVGRFSGHSPRVGMARDLVASGEGLAAVQVAGRWNSAQMPAHYARGELASRGAVARFHWED